MRVSLAFLVLFVTTACAAPEPVRVDMANPASVHCGTVGGDTQVIDTPDGQVGMCILSDGRIVEEWELYRQSFDDSA